MVTHHSFIFWPSPSYPTAYQIAHFQYVQGQGNACNHKHEDIKDGLLCGSGHEAFCGHVAKRVLTYESRHHKNAIQKILASDESYFQDDFEKQLSQVATQQSALDSDFAVFRCIFWWHD